LAKELDSTDNNGKTINYISDRFNLLVPFFFVQFFILTMAFLILYLSARNFETRLDLPSMKITMDGLLDPEVLVHTQSPQMSSLVELFKKNVESRGANFEIIDENNINQGILNPISFRLRVIFFFKQNF
jgi:hypothetical protein